MALTQSHEQDRIAVASVRSQLISEGLILRFPSYNDSFSENCGEDFLRATNVSAPLSILVSCFFSSRAPSWGVV